jgi:hypothetical protein
MVCGRPAALTGATGKATGVAGVAGVEGVSGVAVGFVPAEGFPAAVAVAGTVPAWRMGLVAPTGLVRTLAVLSGRAAAAPVAQAESAVTSANVMAAAAQWTARGRHRIPLSWLLTTQESTRPARP